MTLRLPRPIRLSALAARHGGTLDPDLERRSVAGVARPEDATEEFLAPLTSRRFLRAALASPAVLLVDESLAFAVPAGRRWVHRHPTFALAELLRPLEKSRALRKTKPRVHRTATVARGAQVMSGAVIGAGARVEPNAVVYGDVVIGARVVIGAGAVIGRPGFGWTRSPDGELTRVPQLGGVVIGDDVEIGPLCTIDAGTLGPTIIGRGAKLDAQVHVGHNVEIGEGTMVAAQVGFAGSARVGRGVLIGGQAGIGDHVDVGDGARIGGGAGVIGNVRAGETVAGYPAVDRYRWLRATARALSAVRNKA